MLEDPKGKYISNSIKISFCEKINVHFIIRLKDFFKFDNFLLMHCCI